MHSEHAGRAGQAEGLREAWQHMKRDVEEPSEWDRGTEREWERAQRGAAAPAERCSRSGSMHSMALLLLRGAAAAALLALPPPGNWE